MVLNRLSEAGGRGAGGFFGGIANNPGIVAIVAIIAALLLFRNDIRGAFANFGSVELPDINLPTINFPSFELPTIEFPKFEFPTFEFPTIEFPTFEFPTIEFPNVGGAVTDTFAGATMGVTDFFAGLQTMFNEFVSGFGGESMPTQGDFTEVGQAGARSARGGSVDPIEQEFENIMAQTVDPGVTIAPGIPDPIAPFEGGGVSFIGGTIFETPTEFLSLSQIIDKFMVSATEAANIKLEAQIGAGDLPGGFIPEGFFDQFDSNVSDPTLTGLTPEEIAIRLTGGNILNF